MDYELLVLIGMMVATVLVGIRLNLYWWPARRSSDYQRVFSAGAVGLLLLVAGLIGWELNRSHGFFQGTRWVDGPIWWRDRCRSRVVAACELLGPTSRTRPVSAISWLVRGRHRRGRWWRRPSSATARTSNRTPRPAPSWLLPSPGAHEAVRAGDEIAQRVRAWTCERRTSTHG